MSEVDTLLMVNSCARGQAVPKGDLDFAVLLHPNAPATKHTALLAEWLSFTVNNANIIRYHQSHHFAHIHLDIIEGNYRPTQWDDGGGPDYFKVEIGNHIAYSAPLCKKGLYFQQLKKRWLPYYNDELYTKRLAMSKEACEYDLEHIPFITRRGLHFLAFDRLCKAFQEFLRRFLLNTKSIRWHITNG